MIRSRVASVWGRARTAVRADARDGIAEGAGLLLIGYAFRLALGLVAGALVARALDPGRFGAYAVAGVAVGIGATLADFGLSTSVTRQIAADVVAAPERAFRSAAAYLRLRLLGALGVLVAALVLAGPLATLLGLSGGTGPWLVRLAGVTVVAAAANGVVSTIHHSLRRYRSLVTGQICTSSAVLAGFAVLFLVDRLSLTAAMLVGVAGNLASLALGLALLPPAWRRALLRPAPWHGEESRRLRGFAGWLGVSLLFSATWAQLDLLLVSQLLEPRLVGLYALALALAFKADIVNQVLHTTLLPTVSALSGPDAYAAYARRSLVRSAVLAAILLAALPLVGPFITAVYGEGYAPAAPIFYALMGIVVFDLLTHSVLLLAYPMNLPRRMAAADAVATATLAGLGLVLIPLFGVYGAVAAKLAGKLAAFVVQGSAVARHLRTERREAALAVPAPDPSIVL
ncbi:MAG: oligosaccharide flippase family protein [Gaiellaceae bacterium]